MAASQQLYEFPQLLDRKLMEVNNHLLSQSKRHGYTWWNGHMTLQWKCRQWMVTNQKVSTYNNMWKPLLKGSIHQFDPTEKYNERLCTLDPLALPKDHDLLNHWWDECEIENGKIPIRPIDKKKTGSQPNWWKLLMYIAHSTDAHIITAHYQDEDNKDNNADKEQMENKDHCASMLHFHFLFMVKDTVNLYKSSIGRWGARLGMFKRYFKQCNNYPIKYLLYITMDPKWRRELLSYSDLLHRLLVKVHNVGNEAKLMAQELTVQTFALEVEKANPAAMETMPYTNDKNTMTWIDDPDKETVIYKWGKPYMTVQGIPGGKFYS